jgi:hypothetical protein
MEKIERECELGEEGITERELASAPEFMDLDAFREKLLQEGVPFK